MSKFQVGSRTRAQHKQSVSVTGVDKINKKLEELSRWSIKAHDKFVGLNTRVGEVYANYLRANIKDYDKNISFRGKVVRPGQLRKSAGTWQPDKHGSKVMAGPRTNNILPRKTRWTADGFYAHIVEKGDFGPRFGGKHRTQNTGVFSRGQKATQNRSKKLQVVLLKKEFSRYAKSL